MKKTFDLLRNHRGIVAIVLGITILLSYVLLRNVVPFIMIGIWLVSLITAMISSME